MLIHTHFDHKKQRHVMTDTRPPANAFEWRRYVVEEAIRRGDKQPDPNTTLRRSNAASKAVEKIRETNPMHGIMMGLNKAGTSISLKPRKFSVLNKAKKT
jgi:hypothetical protein